MLVLHGLGKALRWLRAKQDRRQYELAAAAGITKAMLSAYETGKQKPSLDTLEKILDALGADLADLHDALQIVNDRRPQPDRGAGAASPAWRAHLRERRDEGDDSAAPATDVYAVLGLDHPLASAEEEAFIEMLNGFHRLLRYMHYSLSEAAAGDGVAPPPRKGHSGDG
jgi:transcriptional regulator with XRE-family HTH domain